MKTTLLKFFVAAFLINASGFCAMTVGGEYTCEDSCMFMDLVVESTGVMKGKRSEFLNLTIKREGVVDLDGCTVRKNVDSYGVLTALATEFQKDITIYCGNASFTSCKMQNLFIHDAINRETMVVDSVENELVSDSVYVELKDGTVVNGSIFFGSGDGKVYKGHGVTILGEIVGGSVVEQDE